MARQLEWKEAAHRALDEYERGIRRQKPTLLAIAQSSGVSRQTVWRDKDVFARLESIRSNFNLGGLKKTSRASAEMRIRSMQSRIQQLERENGMLVENIVQMSRRLHDCGLDARAFMGQAADNPEIAKAEHVGD